MLDAVLVPVVDTPLVVTPPVPPAPLPKFPVLPEILVRQHPAQGEKAGYEGNPGSHARNGPRFPERGN